MPVAICAGLGDRALVGLAATVPLIEPSHIALLAHRDSEEALAEGSVMPEAARNRHVDRLRSRAGRTAPRETGERIAAQLAEASGRFWLSIDVDVLSSAAMPATPVQQDGGLSLDELAELAAPLARHPACVGLDLLCYDVDMDDRAHTSGRAAGRAARARARRVAGPCSALSPRARRARGAAGAARGTPPRRASPPRSDPTRRRSRSPVR